MAEDEEEVKRETAKRPALIGPAHIVLIAVLMVGEAFLIYFVMGYMRETARAGDRLQLDLPYEQVDLGEMDREIFSDDIRYEREKFKVRVSLVLNPEYEDLSKLRDTVLKRKDYLRDRILRQIVEEKAPEEFRKPKFLDMLAEEMKQLVNTELGVVEGGAEIVTHVIFPEYTIPPRH